LCIDAYKCVILQHVCVKHVKRDMNGKNQVFTQSSFRKYNYPLLQLKNNFSDEDRTKL
jgi:hypothetical protein